MEHNRKTSRVHRENKDSEFFRNGTRNAASPKAKYTTVRATPGPGQESDRHLSGQADFLASALASADPTRFHDLHMAQSVLALPDHLAVFERGIANRLDFAYAGPQSRRLAELVASKAPQDRRDPHLSRTLRAHIGEPDAASRAGCRRQGRPQRQPLHRSEHRGDVRGRNIPRRHRRRVDELDRGRPAAGRHPQGLGFVIPSPKPYLIDPLFTPTRLRSGTRTSR
jgi:malonate decarboxylase alpha subunit